MKKITAEPIGNLVIVQVQEAETQTQSGIYIPQTSQEQPNKGTIVAVGTGMYAPTTGTLIPMQTKVGDEVSYPQHIGADIEIEGVNYKIMKETDLWVKL